MAIKKIKTIEVNTVVGKRTIQFQYGQRSQEKNEDGTVACVCDLDCPYGKICMFLPDPEHSSDDTYRFCDFCSRKGDEAENEQEAEIREMHPVEGSIENSLGDIYPSIFEIIQEKNPIFRLDTIIDRICPGMCGEYNTSHSNCAHAGGLCILQDLFLNKDMGIDIKEEAKKNLIQYDTDRELAEDEKI